MSDLHRCPKCSAPLPADAPAGICPACLLQQGLKSIDATVSMASPVGAAASLATPNPMSIEELAPYFPQLEIIELLGRGGMGVVYKARERHLDRLVALKILPTDVIAAPAFAERFTREAKALAHLSHPHIVTIHDFGQAFLPSADRNSPTTPSVYYLLMEYVEGSNLRGLMKCLAPDQALLIVPQICEALQFAHEEGIVHRDIKPENILVDKKGRVKIADFGLAKLLQNAAGKADYTLTHPDRILGTLHYMAPEQFERPTEVDHRADIYSLGVVFYELLTGHLPLGRFALPSETKAVDARLDEVVLKALEREPEKRYQHASEVKTSVESLRSTPPSAPSTPGDAPVPPASVPATPPKVEPPLPPAPTQQLSRPAVIGAMCGALALLVPPLVLAASYGIHQPDFLARGNQTEWWAIALLCIALVTTGLSVAGMTLLGVIAVRQIRSAPKQLYGLRLALFDALFYPLLFLDGLVAAVFAATFLWNTGAAKAPENSPLAPSATFSAAPLILGLGIWLPIIDVLIYWLIWRKLRIRPLAPARAAIKKHAPATPISAVSTPPIPIAREPKQFYVYAFGLYTLAWLLPLALWNLGWAGFALSVAAFAVICWLQARYLQKFRPEIVAARAAEPHWMKVMRPSNLNLSFSLAFVLILLALALNEDKTLNPDFANIFDGRSQTLAETSQNFLKRFQSEDATRLSADVRDLSLRNVIATFPNGLTVSGGNTEEPALSTLFRPLHASAGQEFADMIGILLYPSAVPPEFRQFSLFSLCLPLGLYCFMAGFVDMLSSKGYKFSGLAWKPALALTGLLIASYFIVAFAGTIVFDAVRSDRLKHGMSPQIQATFPIASNSAQAAENLFPTLDRWAQANGYEIAAFTDGKLNDSHRLPEVPTNVSYRAAVLWKPGLFDRLGMDWEGVYNKAPEILVQAANTDSFSEIDLTTAYYFGGGSYPSSVETNRMQKDLRDTLEKMLTTTQPATMPLATHGAAD